MAIKPINPKSKARKRAQLKRKRARHKASRKARGK